MIRVEVGLPGGDHDFGGTEPALLAKWATLPDKITDPSLVLPGSPAWDLAVSDPPPDLDYDRWIGPSRMEPYIEARVNKNWRWNYNTGGGQLMDWIGHHGDIAHWGLGFDHTGPSEIEGVGEFPAPNALWNTATKYHVECLYKKEVTGYANDVRMTIAGGSGAINMGTKWIGTDGWVWVDRSGFDASNQDWVKWDAVPDSLRKIKLYESVEHRRNFLDCVKSRKPTITPVEVAHHSTLPGHLGLISMLTGRKIQWDVKNEVIVGDDAASALLTRPYRAPYVMVVSGSPRTRRGLCTKLARAFRDDILPLFTERDIHAMSKAFNLASYDDVKKHAAAIYDRIRGIGGAVMPPPPPRGEGPWSQDRIDLFAKWMADGYQP